MPDTLTLDEWTAELGTVDLDIGLPDGRTLKVELRNPPQSASEAVGKILGDAHKDIVNPSVELLKRAAHEAIKAVVVGATEENVVRLAAEGGQQLADACLERLGLRLEVLDEDGEPEAPPRKNSRSHTARPRGKRG